MSEIIELKKNIYNLLRNGDFDNSEKLVLKGMDLDINDNEFEQILKIIKFWNNRKELFTFDENNSHGEKLLNEWENFVKFYNENKIDLNRVLLSIKEYVFKRIIDILIEEYKLSPVSDREKLILLGHAFYEIGILDKAQETLEYALSIYSEDDDPRIYLLLSNIYLENNDEELAIVMLNDAFLKYSQYINLESINYPVIIKLKEKIEKDGFKEDELLEWIPVYGYIYGGLTIRRKIEYKEYMLLKDKIIDYESTLKIDKKSKEVLVPRIINFYFWVFDYYVYQINAFEAATKVIKRVLELVNLIEANNEVKLKLSNDIGIVMNKIINNIKNNKDKNLIKI